LAGAPAIAVLGASALSAEETVRLVGVAGGAAAFALCGIVRDRGKRLEPALWASWGGNPTVQRLRWRDAGDVDAVRRLHARIDPFLDEPLPDESAEREDPGAADRRYGEAVATLRERTRDVARFRLVFAEGTEYGFRRNALGLRPFALLVAGVALVASVAFLLWGRGDAAVRWARWGISGGISAALLFYWWRTVTPDWVRLPAEAYADRLLEAIDTLRGGDGN
jgi:hypothetical protein